MRLSIITVNYNNSDGLRRTLDSVAAQTCREFEFLVIDGGSADGSVDLLRVDNGLIDYWVSEADRGVYHAMNKGVQAAHGDYVLFLNSGDTFYDSEVVARVLNELDGTDVLTGGTWLSFGRAVPAPKTVSMDALYAGTLCHQASFIHRTLLLEQPYDESLRYVADWKFWVQMLIFREGTYRPIDVMIARYDWNGMSTVHYVDVDKEKQAELRKFFPEKVLQDYEHHVVGCTWEEKLYIQVRKSRFHAVIYTFNVCLIRLMQAFRKGAFWIKDYPVRLK